MLACPIDRAQAPNTMYVCKTSTSAVPSAQHTPETDGGLQVDLRRVLIDAAVHQSKARRDALRWLCGALVAPMAACGGGSDDATSETTSSSTTSGSTTSTTTTTTTSTTSTASSGSCSLIHEETAGPYPGDGSNSNGSGVANVLTLSGVVRSDIRSSIAGASGVATGVPLTLRITLVNTSSSCASLEGYAIYLWHCDALGRYSMYSSGITAENYLRGVQTTDATGVASFTTIYPGCYDGRMPHMHFEVYRSTTTATSFSNKLRTSQIAFPNAVSSAVYATSGYGSSANNLSRISFSTDNVFSDGVDLQLVSISGNVTDGYVATLRVGISV
jgi:protocatechuate 3,4-dioxygenase beta subunit